MCRLIEDYPLVMELSCCYVRFVLEREAVDMWVLIAQVHLGVLVERTRVVQKAQGERRPS